MRTFGDLYYDRLDDKWVLDKVEPHVMIKLKTVFPKVPKNAIFPYALKHSGEAAVDLAWFIDRYPLKINEEDYAFLKSSKENQLATFGELAGFFTPDYVPAKFDLKKPMRVYQSQAVELYLKVKRFLLGDVLGLGKTLCAIGSFCDPRTLPAAVVVQTHLPPQWVEKIEEFSHFKVHVIKNGPAYQLPPADVYIFKYGQILKWVNIFHTGMFKSAIFDEVQELRRQESQKYSSAQILSNHVDFTMGLSAIPVFNYGDEIWNILDLLKPGCLDTKENFIREWAGSYGHAIENPKALGAYLRENFLFLRRTREEVKRELPPVNTIVETVDYDQDEVDKIENTARMLAQKIMHGSFEERGRASRDLDMLVRQATGVSKAKYVAEYVKMLVESGESVLLAGWHRDVYDIWLRELKDLNPVMYTGSESPAQKERSKKAFIDGTSKIMIISLRSGAGIDGLQKSGSIVVFGELDWSPAIHDQVTGRLNRDGQEYQVTQIFLISNSGSDPGIVDMLGIKASQASGIIDPFETVKVQHRDDSRIKVLAKKYLEKQGLLDV